MLQERQSLTRRETRATVQAVQEELARVFDDPKWEIDPMGRERWVSTLIGFRDGLSASDGDTSANAALTDLVLEGKRVAREQAALEDTRVRSVTPPKGQINPNSPRGGIITSTSFHGGVRGIGQRMGGY